MLLELLTVPFKQTWVFNFFYKTYSWQHRSSYYELWRCICHYRSQHWWRHSVLDWTDGYRQLWGRHLAIAISLTRTVLCGWIYAGYVHICGSKWQHCWVYFQCCPNRRWASLFRKDYHFMLNLNKALKTPGNFSGRSSRWEKSINLPKMVHCFGLFPLTEGDASGDRLQLGERFPCHPSCDVHLSQVARMKLKDLFH